MADRGLEIAETEQEGGTLKRVSWIVLWASLVLLFAHVFIPTHQFIHRGDDAFYYFETAVNHVRQGFWSFDSIHPTNGVQPLWAYILTGAAHVLSWLGVEDKDTLARIFVGIAALLHFLTALVLFRFLLRRTTPGIAIGAAGALVFPVGFVWNRLWGMETALYGLLLVSTIAYLHQVYLRRTTPRSGAVLGLLLGLTILARLNAGVFAICVGVYCLFLPRSLAFRARFRAIAVAAAVAAFVVVPYFAHNYATTGHLMSVSGSVKQVQTEQFLENHEIESRASPAFARVMFHRYKYPVRQWLTERSLDGMWIGGSRVIFGVNGAIPPVSFLLTWMVLLGAPMLFGKPREWWVFLRARLKLLAPFVYVLAFAILNAGLVVLLYPTQLSYAAPRWWLVETDLMLVVLSATVVVSALAFCGRRVRNANLRTRVACTLLVALAVFQVPRMTDIFFGKEVQTHDWKLSWNDKSHGAAQWLDKNVPEDALVGSWNAGVLGYYSKQRVVNLDGLINNFDLVPYIRERRVSDYIRKERIEYLCDMGSIFSTYRIVGTLKLEEVYSRWTPSMNDHYKIYKVTHDVE